MTTPIKNMTIRDIRNAISNKEKNSNELNLFNATKKIGSYIEFDDNRRKSSVPISNADEILKYKNLMDEGIITKEEFEAKKKQLLGL